MATASESNQGSGKGALRDLLTQVLPLGPLAMKLKNRGEMARRRRDLSALGLPELDTPERFLPEVLELCGYNERVFPENAHHWKRAAEFAQAQASGPAALLDQVKEWGFVRDARGDLEVPEWWSGLVVPIEYMDYHPDRHSPDELRALGVPEERYHALARKASDSIWMGYYLAKGALFQGGVSLLIKEVTDSVHALKDRVDLPMDGPLPIYVIGISEDEVAALRGPDVAVVAFNQGLSPVMKQLLQSGQVHALVARSEGGEARLLDAATLEPVVLARGHCYVCQLDASQSRLPVADASGLAMTNETLHHNAYPAQAAMIRELHRVALPVRGGGKAWIAGELFRVADMPRVFVSLAPACGPTIWDAFVSFANGIACVEELVRRTDEWAAEGIHLRFTHVPRGLVGAPAFVHRLLMCPTQALITGY